MKVDPATGALFLPFGHPGDEALRPISTRFREVPKEELWRLAIGEIFAGACAGAAIPGLVETLERWRPSVVLRESHEFAGLVAAEKVGIPHLRVAICAQGAEADILSFAAPRVTAQRMAREIAALPLVDDAADAIEGLAAGSA